LSSGASALHFGDAEMIGVGGLGGGVGSVIGGGSFYDGFTQGISVAAFNHGLHSLTDPPRVLPEFKNGKPFLPGFEDAEYVGRSKGVGRRYVWKLPDGKYLEWTFKNGVVEMYNKTGEKWLGKYNPSTGKLITSTSKLGRFASFLGKGITRVFGWMDFICIPCLQYNQPDINSRMSSTEGP
jgi:hypothetical protein